MQTYYFIMFLCAAGIFWQIYLQHEKEWERFAKQVSFECWYWLSLPSSKLEVFRDSNEEDRRRMLAVFAKRKPFSRKRLYSKLLAVSDSSSELTSFHLGLLELLADFDPFTRKEHLTIMYRYRGLPVAENDALMDILNYWHRVPVLIAQT